MSGRIRWSALGAAFAVALGAGATLPSASASVGSGARDVFVPVVPCRLVDTRPATQVGPRVTPLGPGETAVVAVTGSHGNCAIPADAVAVSMNVTAVNGTAGSYLSLWPAGAPRPTTANLTWVPGAPPTPNKVDVGLSSDGRLDLFDYAGTVDVVVDVFGYYADHNFDDRYYTKSQVDAANAQIDATIDAAAPHLHTVVYGATSIVQNGTSSPVIPNGCRGYFPQSVGDVPLQMPLGARLVSVDATMEYIRGTQWQATVYEDDDSPSGVSGAPVTAIVTGSANGTSHVVLTPTTKVVQRADDQFVFHAWNLSDTAGFCKLALTYDTNG